MIPRALPLIAGAPPVFVRGFALDSRQVAPGFVFGAFAGARANGEDFIADAVAAGAIAVVARPEAMVPTGTLHVADQQPRRRFAELSAAFYQPGPAMLAAVTGTNGKTSVADLVRQMWRLLGRSAASIGTLGVITSHGTQDMGMTSPDAATFHRTLGELAGDGCSHVIFEASSHGLDQDRVHGRPVQVAAFTNLSRDHLDYHGTMEAYFAAKLTLFTSLLSPDGTAVVWADDAPWSGRVIEACRARGVRVLDVGASASALTLKAREVLPNGQRLLLEYSGDAYTVFLPLIGAYQAANALVAAGVVLASGLAPAAVFAALERLEGVPGRLEYVGQTRAQADVFVDYAHTPDGLKAAITALRPHVRGRLWVVFGCGGDRDGGKRPQMGAIATQLADSVIVTDDNPRSEQPSAIRRSILAAAPGAREIGDRAQAIATAIGGAQAGDVVLIAGKGHEQGQIVGDTVLPFDDRVVARQAVAA